MSMTEFFRNRFNLGGGFREATQGFFRTPEEPAEPIYDARRLERIAEHVQDRQILTEVETHDSEMLARVRAALYAKD